MGLLVRSYWPLLKRELWQAFDKAWLKPALIEQRFWSPLDRGLFAQALSNLFTLLKDAQHSKEALVPIYVSEN